MTESDRLERVNTPETPTSTPIAQTVGAARTSFQRGVTRPLSWRRRTLETLREHITASEPALTDALTADLGKPPIEGWVTEIGFVIADIEHTLDNIGLWTRPRRVPTPLVCRPGSSRIVFQPVGVVAVIAPWNYPFHLVVAPMVAAIAAGNAVVGKPSELAPATSAVVAELIRSLDDPAVGVVVGGVPETTELLAQRFDHILYTGNGRVGRIVMRAAAEHLTPVTLELGGKSPAVVSRHARVETTARRIAWGKFLNAGQTCIAPDYVLVERPVHDELVAALGQSIDEFYGADPQASPDYARIVNDAHFDRLQRLLADGTVVAGGQTDREQRYIAPTVLTEVSRDSPVMEEEIFGPILPVLAVESIDEAIDVVNSGDEPLALYAFSERPDETRRIVARTTSGSACVNGTVVQVGNPNLPFGGVGESGMGAYHGRTGFETFSHRRGVLIRSTRVDPPLAYPPYTPRKQQILRRALTVPEPRDLLARLRAMVRPNR
jgi:aldehyde dehydrogenase (NAD+)